MEVFESQIHQVFVKLLDGKHRILNFEAPSISVSALKHHIHTLTSIPSHLQLLLADNSRVLYDHQTLTLAHSRWNSPSAETLRSDSKGQLTPDQEITRFGSTGLAENLAGSDMLGKFPVVVHLLLRLRGGKGGFGSLLRGAATKAGQKKTNNFDACRDMSGRRLRHVNAEKKLEEWRAEAEERKLEKMAEEFIKKKAKEVLKSGKGKGGDSAEKYVAKYREDSAKCMEEVERSVRESIKGLVNSKRKSQAEGSEYARKRLKIWYGKRKFDDSDSEDLDDDDTDEEEENDKSVIIDNGGHSNSGKEVEASSGSITGGELDSRSDDQGPSENTSSEETAEESVKSVRSIDGCVVDHDSKIMGSPVLESLQEIQDSKELISAVPEKSHYSPVDQVVSHQPGTSGSEDEVVSAADSVIEECVTVTESLENTEKPLNFDDYHSAVELEVLGLERLKSELQARGLKCGGALRERAARLFLLKTTALEMLPKKLFAKK